MIETHDLSKQFNKFLAVDKISLRVEPGEILALLGPNGAGKTTTVRMLTSVLQPTGGWAKVAGYDIVQQAARVRQSVGVLTEQHGLYRRMPAYDYLDFFGQLYGMEANQRKERVDNLLDIFGLSTWRKNLTGEFSKGMQQKLALARALLHNPPVLLLDEPTSAMDPESAHLVRESIRQMRSSERTIIICTHNLAEAEMLADRIAIIRHGKIIVRGTLEALKLTLLGPPEYEVQVSRQLNGEIPELPPGILPTSQGSNWFRYQVAQPERLNPLILQGLHHQGFPVTFLREVPRSLEHVYMSAMAILEEAETLDVD